MWKVSGTKIERTRARYIFYRYDTFIERSCEQLNIAKRQQMNVEISA